MFNVKLGCALALEGKQLVSVVLVLLAACHDFGRETRLKGSGQGLEAVEDGDDAVLLFQRRDWNFEVFILLWNLARIVKLDVCCPSLCWT